MPTWGEILKELEAARDERGRVDLDGVRRSYLRRLAEHTGRDTILYATKWTQSSDADPALLSITDEDVQGFMEMVKGLRSGKLDLILHSPGGSPEAAEAVVRYLRTRFDDIRVIVPQAAMSAATMMACAADTIVMGNHSSLGPIDPQFILSGQFGTRAVPAQAILQQFDLAKKECADPSVMGAWLPMLSQYGPALLIQCQNALQMAEDLVAQWLEQWMFRGEPDAKARARAIAQRLKDHQAFKSHARHLSADDALGIGLRVEKLEADTELQDLALSVFHVTTQTFDRSPAVKLIENHEGRAFVKTQHLVPIPGGVQVFQPSAPPEAVEEGLRQG